MCFLCRSQREPSDIENTARSVDFRASPRVQEDLFHFFCRKLKPAGGTSEKLNLSFESEQQHQQLGCLQTTPKIFRFSKERNRNHQLPQRLPLAAFESRTADRPGNTGETRRTDLALSESDWRNVELQRPERTEAGEEQINQGFLRDSPERASPPISGPVVEQRTKMAARSSSPEDTNKVPTGKNFKFSFTKTVCSLICKLVNS